jgi:hypothetical protein
MAKYVLQVNEFWSIGATNKTPQDGEMLIEIV